MPKTHARFELTSDGEAFRVYASGFDPIPEGHPGYFIAQISLAGGAVVDEVDNGMPDNAVRAAATAAAAVSALNAYVGQHGDDAFGMLDSYDSDDIGGGLTLHWPLAHGMRLRRVGELAELARATDSTKQRQAAIDELARRAALAGPRG